MWFFFSVNKQVNDKERVAAAMENPNLIKIVENCIKEDEWCVLGKQFYLCSKIPYLIRLSLYSVISFIH